MEKIFTKKGNINTNSTSKMIKIIEIKKNRRVKGKRALNLGVNPHSKGLIFSIIKMFFLLKREPRDNTTTDKIKEVKKTTIKYKIN